MLAFRGSPVPTHLAGRCCQANRDVAEWRYPFVAVRVDDIVGTHHAHVDPARYSELLQVRGDGVVVDAEGVAMARSDCPAGYSAAIRSTSEA